MTTPGSVGEEAARLLEAARDWLHGAVDPAAGPECRYCPLCQLLALLRRDPDRIGEFAAMARRLVEDVITPPSAAPDVEHIDLD